MTLNEQSGKNTVGNVAFQIAYNMWSYCKLIGEKRRVAGQAVISYDFKCHRFSARILIESNLP